jgi:hypothetical protein
LVRPVGKIPKGAVKQKRDSRIVLAYGEVTGHAHAIADEAVDVFVTAEGTMYLWVKTEATLKHEEHGAITLPPGNYERVLQREYSPEAIRKVRD